MLAAQAGLSGRETRGEGAAATLADATDRLGRSNNQHIELRDAADIDGIASQLIHGRSTRTLAPPRHLSGMPECFTAQSPVAHTPTLSMLGIQGGYCCHFPDGPVIVTARGDAVVRDYSSPYAGLVHHYDVDLQQMLADAYQVNGTAIVMADDVRPLNFSHWLVDWLPRLSVLGERARRDDTFVVVPPLNAAYQWDTLRLCGFDPGRVIELKAWHAVRARHLIVPSDLQAIPHPGHKAAPWLLHYLRSTLGYGAFLAGLNGPQRRTKLYLSRDTAVGRRIVNEDALTAVLLHAGYRKMDTSGMSIAQQIQVFATASHIVAPHGAGLANIVFGDAATTLIEMFPISYGTAAYYVLSAGLGMTYASYISGDVIPGSRTQLDDFAVDVADFVTRCGALL